MRQVNLSKSTKCSKFHRRNLLHDRMFELIKDAKSESVSFSLHVFGSYFISCGFAYRAKR